MRDILIRAGKTFWQAAVAAVVVGIHSGSTYKVAAVGAVAAGVSAAWNAVVWPFLRSFLRLDQV